MSDVFFAELGLPAPDLSLGVGSGSHAQQTAAILIAFERVLEAERPDWVVVVGDVNSTAACTLAAAKMGIPVAHVEAGLRSFDRSMPEEVNRVVTDHLAQLLFTSEPSGNINLANEGIDPATVHFVGNVMIDTLVRQLPAADDRWARVRIATGLSDGDPFVLVTLHRPANVDAPGVLATIMEALETLADDMAVVFPVHPRTRARIAASGAIDGHVRLLDPLGYVDFLALQRHAHVVVTDSGGVQEETAYLGVRCLTVRPNTERPATIDAGTNRLIAATRDAIVEGVRANGSPAPPMAHRIPDLWDGRAAERIVAVFRRFAEA